MAKRNATSELNHENWNEDDDPEEAGTFQKASADDLQRRTVVKARRRVVKSDLNSDGKNAFSGFTGFSMKPVTSTSYSPPASEKSYNFCSNSTTTHTVSSSLFGGGLTSTSLSSSTGLSTPLASNTSLKNGFNWATASKETDAAKKPVVTAGAKKNTEDKNVEQSSEEKSKDGRNAEQLHQLKALNESVSVWIKQHVDRNPYCILTPIFRDYDKYVQDLQLDKAVREDAAKAPASDISSASNVETKSFTFATSKTNEDIPSTAAQLQGDEEEVYKPPVNEVQAVKEEDSFYSIRCKLFFKKDGVYVDKGVGTLYLKLNNSKTQLVVRAETNLGNILLNIILSSSVPTQRTGANNVSLICVPNPPIDKLEGPVPFLIRVKTGSDADELMAQLDKAKIDQR